MSVGLYGYVGIGVESSGGTASSSVNIVDWLPIVSETLAEQRNDLQSNAITGIPDVQNICTGPQNIAGGVNVEVQPVSIGYLHYNFFDSTSTAVGSSGSNAFYGVNVDSHATIRAHRFIAGTSRFQSGSGSDIPTLTYHAFRGPGAVGVDSAVAYFNAAGTDFERTFDTGAFIIHQHNVQARASAFVPSTTPVLAKHVCFTWDAVSISIDGTADATFQNLTIRGNNQLEFVRTLDTTINPSLLKRNGLRTFEISGNMSFQSQNQYLRFKAGSEFGMVITALGPVIANNIRHSERWNLPRVKFTSFAPNINGPGFISVPFQGTAYYHPGSLTACDVWLVNTRTNPYTVNSNA